MKKLTKKLFAILLAMAIVVSGNYAFTDGETAEAASGSIVLYDDAFMTNMTSHASLTSIDAPTATGRSNKVLQVGNNYARLWMQNKSGINITEAKSNSGKLVIEFFAQSAAESTLDVFILNDANDTYNGQEFLDFTVNAGWNTLEIPAKNITANTIYGISVYTGIWTKTEGGVYHYLDNIRFEWEEGEEPETPTYTVDITWPENVYFDYKEATGEWSLATENEQGDDITASNSNEIQIRNAGTAAVSIDFAYASRVGYESMSGTFYENGESFYDRLVLDVAGEKTVTFMPSGTVEDETFTQVGDITFTISSKTEYDAPTRYICLTFDDGPSTSTMDRVLGVFADYNAQIEYDAHATFFVQGNKIDTSTECQNALKRAVTDGHEIGNHSWSHQSLGLDNVTESVITSEITQTQNKVYDVAGVTPKYFRPPNLSVSNLLKSTVKMPFINMSTDTYDYESVKNGETVDAEYIYKRAIAGVEDGAIILQHCYQGNEKTVEALKMILAWCAENGYQPVTVSKMVELKGAKLENGTIYTNFITTN